MIMLQTEEKRLKVKIAEMAIQEIRFRIRALNEDIRRADELHELHLALATAQAVSRVESRIRSCKSAFTGILSSAIDGSIFYFSFLFITYSHVRYSHITRFFARNPINRCLILVKRFFILSNINTIIVKNDIF